MEKLLLAFSCASRNVCYRRCNTRCLATAFTKPVVKERKWEAVIGLEIHAQISARSKLFSGSPNKFAAPVNTQVSFFDAALPGTLPVLNRRCVEAGVLTALALQCNISSVSSFDRKHYFYADLPAGYQITQQRQPLARGGHIPYIVSRTSNNAKRETRIARFIQLQLEQDSGKSLHDIQDSISLIDLNRAGVGLMEIITEPDFRSADEAAAFVKELQLILLTIGTCDGKMEEGSLRVDASVSLREPNGPLGVRAEVKNLNSVRSLTKAIEYEITRQMLILESGGEVLNETRAFDVEACQTIAMRDKERVHDYRFMAEPNLLPLHVYTDATVPGNLPLEQIVNIDGLRSRLPELPSSKRERLQKVHCLSLDHSSIIVNEPGLVECFEQIIADSGRSAKVSANICINDVFAALNKQGISYMESGLTSEHIGELVDLVSSSRIAVSTVRKVVEILLNDRTLTPTQIIAENDWLLITDDVLLETVCEKIVSANEKAVSEYWKGKKKLLNFFVGQVQIELGGKADARTVTRILQRLLSK